MGDIRDNISKNIMFYRKKMGLTQSQLGEQLGVKSTTVSSWERGANSPDIETLYIICKLFGVSLDEMYGIKPEEPQTIAAHFDGDQYTQDELEEINKFAEFVRQRRKK